MTGETLPQKPLRNSRKITRIVFGILTPLAILYFAWQINGAQSKIESDSANVTRQEHPEWKRFSQAATHRATFGSDISPIKNILHCYFLYVDHRNDHSPKTILTLNKFAYPNSHLFSSEFPMKHNSVMTATFQTANGWDVDDQLKTPPICATDIVKEQIRDKEGGRYIEYTDEIYRTYYKSVTFAAKEVDFQVLPPPKEPATLPETEINEHLQRKPTGVNGLELERHQELHPQSKKQVIILNRDAWSQGMLPNGLTDKRLGQAYAITLTIDDVIQHIAEKELVDAVTRTHAKSGSIIVLEPQTGAILAMAGGSRPDPNTMPILKPDTYEPGPAIGAIIAAAALEEKVIRPNTMVFGEQGNMTIANMVIHDHEKLGWMTFAEVIQKSSNIGMAKTGMLLGDEQLYRYLRSFGFGQRTDVDLPGEVSGLLKPPGEWGERTLAYISMGVGIEVTPLQLASAISAIANNGVLMKPYVVSEIRDNKGDLLKKQMPQFNRRVVSPTTARVLTSILEKAVTDGTGTKAAMSGFRVAGKTGTSQKVNSRDGTYSTTQFVGSFVGYVPANAPRIVMIVVIDEPQGEAWGGLVAAPVFRRVSEQTLKYLGVLQDN